MVSLVKSRINATRTGWHPWEIDSNLPLGHLQDEGLADDSYVGMLGVRHRSVNVGAAEHTKSMGPNILRDCWESVKGGLPCSTLGSRVIKKKGLTCR